MTRNSRGEEWCASDYFAPPKATEAASKPEAQAPLPPNEQLYKDMRHAAARERKPEPQAQAGEPEVMKWPDAPQTIYLQVCAEDDGECHTPFHEHTEVTWCEDKINDSDIKYVRDETIAKKDAALKACVGALFAASPDDKDQWQAAITQAQEAMK